MCKNVMCFVVVWALHQDITLDALNPYVRKTRQEILSWVNIWLKDQTKPGKFMMLPFRERKVMMTFGRRVSFRRDFRETEQGFTTRMLLSSKSECSNKRRQRAFCVGRRRLKKFCQRQSWRKTYLTIAFVEKEYYIISILLPTHKSDLHVWSLL